MRRMKQEAPFAAAAVIIMWFAIPLLPQQIWLTISDMAVDETTVTYHRTILFEMDVEYAREIERLLPEPRVNLPGCAAHGVAPFEERGDKPFSTEHGCLITEPGTYIYRLCLNPVIMGLTTRTKCYTHVFTIDEDTAALTYNLTR